MRWDKEKEAREFIAEINSIRRPITKVHCTAEKPVELLESALRYIQKLENEIDNEYGGL